MFRFQNSVSLITTLFGSKAHNDFPRKYREPGPGGCASGGFYPTDSDGAYSNPGVDLEIPFGGTVICIQTHDF